jgi:hypothetical protein
MRDIEYLFLYYWEIGYLIVTTPWPESTSELYRPPLVSEVYEFLRIEGSMRSA